MHILHAGSTHDSRPYMFLSFNRITFIVEEGDWTQL